MVICSKSYLSRHIGLAADILLLLEVTLEAEHLIAGYQELLVDGTMRVVAGGATLAQRLMLEDERALLRRVALETDFILAHQVGGAAPLHDGTLVGIVAIGAAHPAFHDTMTIRQAELGADFQMALEAGLRFLARVDDEFRVAAGIDMEASGTMTAFTSCVFGILSTGLESGMIRCLEITDYLIMAIGAGLGTHKCRAGNVRRCHDGILKGSAGNQPHHQGGGTSGNP